MQVCRVLRCQCRCWRPRVLRCQCRCWRPQAQVEEEVEVPRAQKVEVPRVGHERPNLSLRRVICECPIEAAYALV